MEAQFSDELTVDYTLVLSTLSFSQHYKLDPAELSVHLLEHLCHYTYTV